jgi:hypothetical protein
MSRNYSFKPAELVGGKLIRLSIAYFYNLGAAMKQARYLIDSGKTSPLKNFTIAELWPSLKTIENEINGLFATEWFLPALRSAFQPGQALLNQLKTITDSDKWTDFVEPSDLWQIDRLLADFETVLKSELNISDSYFVSRKGGFDTTALIANAESIFPHSLITKAPDSIRDIRESGKCLAFELSTASGFHILRATESVVRIYWDVVSNAAPHPDIRSLGVFLAEMEKNKFGSDKVRAVLKQIKDLHRNPLIHPEVIIDLDEAIGLFGICRSAVGAMLAEIPD